MINKRTHAHAHCAYQAYRNTWHAVIEWADRKLAGFLRLARSSDVRSASTNGMLGNLLIPNEDGRSVKTYGVKYNIYIMRNLLFYYFIVSASCVFAELEYYPGTFCLNFYLCVLLKREWVYSWNRIPAKCNFNTKIYYKQACNRCNKCYT